MDRELCSITKLASSLCTARFTVATQQTFSKSKLAKQSAISGQWSPLLEKEKGEDVIDYLKKNCFALLSKKSAVNFAW